MKKGLISFLLNLKSSNTSEKAGKNLMNFCQNSFIYARLSKVFHDCKLTI